MADADVTSPLEALVQMASVSAAKAAAERSLEPELGGGFSVEAESIAAGTEAGRLVGLASHQFTALMLAGMDARYAPRARKVTAVTWATYDLQAADDILQVDYTATAAVTNLRLMTALMVPGRTVTVSDTGGGAATKNITITTEGDEKIAGQDTYTISTAGGWVVLAVNADGTGWIVVQKG